MRYLIALTALVASPAAAKEIEELPIYETVASAKSPQEISDCIALRLSNPDRIVVSTGTDERRVVLVRAHMYATFHFDIRREGDGTIIDIRRRNGIASGLKRAKTCF